ncbi:MAG: DNA-3-methyladenine glycosylase family protein [Gammaproteobacteria bacterium]
MTVAREKRARITSKVLEQACYELAQDCPHMHNAFARTGVPPLRRSKPGFATLARLVCEQSISLAAADAILSRLETRTGGLTPENVMSLGAAAIQSVGLTRNKAACIAELASATLDGRLELQRLARMDDDEVLKTLTQFKGIGQWTGEIYLLFALMRPDVWPAGDVAIVIAVQRLLDRPERPGPKEAREIGERWRPWRSVAARILWRYYHLTHKDQ